MCDISFNISNEVTEYNPKGLWSVSVHFTNEEGERISSYYGKFKTFKTAVRYVELVASKPPC